MSDEVNQTGPVEPITITYEVSPQNMFSAFRVYDKKHGLSPMGLLKRGGIYVPASAGFAWLIKLTWMFPVMVIVFYAVHFFESKYTRRRQVRKLFAEKSFGGQCTLTFSEDGIKSSSALGESKVNWSYATDIVETPEELILFGKGCQVTPIPKIAFSDDTQLAAFRTLLQLKVNSDS
jgi:hypothetical protein